MLALKALNDVGLSVPEEIVIIGFKKLAALLPPPLTVIQPSAMQQGLLAMRFVKRPRGDEDPPRAIPLESFLVVCGRTANPGESAGASLGTEARR